MKNRFPAEHQAAVLAKRPEIALGDSKECKLCSYPAHHFAYVDFNKSCNNAPLPRSGISVEYFRCQRCELLFTDFFDDWSKEEFSTYIYNESYFEVDPEYSSIRPARSAEDLTPSLVGAEGLRILDYGSGAGMFEKEMKARGFSRIESYDPFSSPDRPDGLFDIITCFDVIEHSTDPKKILADIMTWLAPDGCALVGQTLQPANIRILGGEWWYIAPRNGHVTTFSCETLHLYAEASGIVFTDFGDLFALTRSDPSDITRAIIDRRSPQPRRLMLHAPSAATKSHEAWHDAEKSSSGSFRWTREADVCLGIHETPRGIFRVVLNHLGKRDEAFLAKSRISVGSCESAIEVHEDELFAVFDLPYAAWREVSIRTPEPFSDAAIGIGTDLRRVGLAISCAAVR